MSDHLQIVKNNYLIDNFVFNATELELQILNYAVAVTNPYWDSKDWVHRISIPDLVEIYGSKKNKRSWEQYRSALLRLQLRTYVFFVKNKKNTIPLIKMVTEDIKDNSYLEFKFSDYVQERIQNLIGLFTQYDIKNIAMFSSRYSFMLYEFFKMKLSQSDSVLYSKNVKICDFKKNLNLDGKYKIFRDLRNNVLEKSKLQINKHSDIHINYEIIKTGRTPTYIKFMAKYKKGKSPDVNLDNHKPQTKIENLPNNISDVLKHQPLSEKQLKERKAKWHSVKAKLKNKL